MSDARAAMLDRIRRASGRADHDDTEVRVRLARRPTGPKPALHDAPLDAFVARVEAAAATIARCDGEGIGVAVADYLQRSQLAPELVSAPHPALADVAWPAGLTAHRRALAPSDATAMTVAAIGIAETGSLLLTSGPQTPTGMNFLPDTLICLLDAARIVPHLEDAWAWLRDAHATPPRAVNLVTGPSRTADVEQTIQLGAHGPRRLHVVLVSRLAS
ncbi:MAG: LUD domain-containing protein [Ectothiorhodospiraceae bacterium]|jgi:L-lactate dehydrogenase complex protein LldG|nr:LUD domain-containing protein [Ectothiorhodospiraceae bacterium]